MNAANHTQGESRQGGRWGWWLTQTVRFVIATAIGAGIGFGVYAISSIGGEGLYVATGALAGAAASVAIQIYNRAARLTEVKITVPQLSELTFVVNDDARRVAWQLYVEAVTRISTQALPDDAGLIREAMNSLYGLFSMTRDTLKGSRPTVVGSGPTVEYLAVTMLNRELRPFLSKWHPRLRAYETAHPDSPEADWPSNAECRSDLRALQARLHEYVLGYAQLAGVRDAIHMLGAAAPPSDR